MYTTQTYGAFEYRAYAAKFEWSQCTSTILRNRVFTLQLQYLGDYPSHKPMNLVVIFEVIVGISLSRFENYPRFVDDVTIGV